jgi:hypothetical protein
MRRDCRPLPMAGLLWPSGSPYRNNLPLNAPESEAENVAFVRCTARRVGPSRGTTSDLKKGRVMCLRAPSPVCPQRTLVQIRDYNLEFLLPFSSRSYRYSAT